jgi:hypothetical protein
VSITLEPPGTDKLREIWRIAADFQTACEQNGISNTWKESNQATREVKIRMRWFGFVGSFMLSEHLGLSWNEGLQGFNNRAKHGDVGEYDCRTRTKPQYELSVRTMDTRIQILLRPERVWNNQSERWHEYPKLKLMGWNFPWYVRRPEWESKQRGVFFMPDRELIHINMIDNADWWESYLKEIRRTPA